MLTEEGQLYAKLLDKLDHIYEHEELGKDCLYILNLIAGLMLETTEGFESAKLFESWKHDKLSVRVNYGDHTYEPLRNK